MEHPDTEDDHKGREPNPHIRVLTTKCPSVDIGSHIHPRENLVPGLGLPCWLFSVSGCSIPPISPEETVITAKHVEGLLYVCYPVSTLKFTSI